MVSIFRIFSRLARERVIGPAGTLKLKELSFFLKSKKNHSHAIYIKKISIKKSLNNLVVLNLTMETQGVPFNYNLLGKNNILIIFLHQADRYY